jgi:AcrR family transcriptional regulator
MRQMARQSANRSTPRTASSPPPDRIPLDRSRILAAALRLMDAKGLDALSMRKLAAELDVEAMSLYYHVSGKAALLEGLAETVLAEVRLPRGEGGDRAGATRGIARALRANALAHPDAIPLLATLGFGSAAARRHTEDVLDVLGSAGFTPPAAFTTFLLIRSYVLGFVIWEIRHAEARAAGMVPPTEVGTLISPDLPHLASIATLIMMFDNDAEFERGLDVLVGGLEPAAHD